MGSISIVTNEKQTLRCLIAQPSLILLVEEDMFLSEQGSALYKTIGELFVRSMQTTRDHLISEGNRHSSYVTPETVDALLTQEFDPDSFLTYYLPRLRKDFAKKQIQDLLNGDLKVVAESKGDLDLPTLQGHLVTIEKHIARTEDKKNILYSASQAASQYGEALIKRDSENISWRSGCTHLDDYLTVGLPPKNITTLFGATGTGKSAYALYLESKRINRRLPSVYVSLEMDLISTFDRLCAMRRKIKLSDLYPHDGHIQDHVMSQILDELEAIKRAKSFWFVEETGLCIKDLATIARDAKRFMGADSLTMTVDLFSMLRDFAGQDAGGYEDGVNLTYEMCKRENIHMILVVQANRKADSTRIASIDQLHYLRPTRNTVKNSAEMMNRSRIGLSVFRPKFYAEQLFPGDVQLEAMDDVLEVQMLKQSQGEAGEILRYLFQGATFSITPYKPADDAVPTPNRTTT